MTPVIMITQNRDDIAWKATALPQFGRIDETEAIMRKLLDEASEHPWWQSAVSSKR